MNAGTFEIVVKGTMSPTFLAAFDGFSATASQHHTRLVGCMPDQAQLHGALAMLRDLGVELISVVQLTPPSDAPCPSPEENDRGGFP